MKVLIVVDMQNDFVDGVLGSKEAVSMIDTAVATINSFILRILMEKTI